MQAGTANLRFKAREPSSESVVVRYATPAPVCTPMGLNPNPDPHPDPDPHPRQVRYAIPFGLNVENQGGEGLQKGTVVRAVVTKDGTGGEKVNII